MSIYTITLKRELLSGSEQADSFGSSEGRGQADWLRRCGGDGVDGGEGDEASVDEAGRRELGAAAIGALADAGGSNGSNLGAKKQKAITSAKGPAGEVAFRGDRDSVGPKCDDDDYWLDCWCGSTRKSAPREEHSSECLRRRGRQLEEQAARIEHSVNVTLEVKANLRQPNRIVWFKNSQQLTSSDQPVLFVRSRRSIKRLKSRSVETSTGEVVHGEQVKEEEEEEVEVRKCVQESSEFGSKLTIHDIQDEDYGQYTCKLIGPDGSQLDIQTQLKFEEEDENERRRRRASGKSRQELIKRRSYRFATEMDELIEVKEGDVNIELGIQILPEVQDDEELMSEEEKRDFIDGTTITWFKDDQKLSSEDEQVCRLFQFTFDQNEGFHKLIVLRASKETEGVYTCLVENESGTSSCSTQLVVGPGNKPKLTSRLQDVTVYVGQSLEFRIKSTGLPPIDSCQWFRDDRLLIEMANSSRQLEVRSSTNERVSMSRAEESTVDGERMIIFKLSIDSLKLDDSGRYKCRIINEFGYDETDCQVKVLQEIIEEHEEIEETIEETMRLGGGKKSTREEEEVEETRVDEEESYLVKRQRQEQEDEGRAPRFVRELEDQELSFSHEEELVVATERDEWSDSKQDLRIRWFYEDEEISSSSGHKIENFYEKSSEQWQHRLIIKSSRSSGRYSCRASNKFGECQTSCLVTKRTSRGDVTRRPRFMRQLEDTETYVGETIVMRVALDDSIDLDELQFSKDGKLVYSSRRDGQESRELGSGGLNQRSKVRIRTYTEVIEEETTVTSSTSSRYTRRQSNRPAGTKARVFELEVEDVQVDSMGSWVCEARNEAGESTCRAEVEVFAEPKIVTDLEEKVRVAPGKEIRLTVEASGSPRPVYSWFKDGQGIAEEEERVFTETTSSSTTTTSTTKTRRTSVSSMRAEEGVSISGETLIIKGARPDDAGAYTCKIENRLGQVESRRCSLTIIGHGDDLHSAPRIIKDFSRDQMFQVDEGESVTLKVLAEGHPRPHQRWFKDTEEIVERVSRFEVENEGQEYSLKVRRSEASDSGRYKVVLRNEHGETESRTVEVRVVKVSEEVERERRPSAPTIQLDSQDKVVGLGSNISFDVQVGGHPKPFITWYKNGRRMTESSDGRVSFVEEETVTTVVEEEETSGERVSRKETSTIHRLVIRNVRDTDEAIYSLKAENDLGSAKSSLVSLTIDKRKESVDELEERNRSKQIQQQEHEEEETTTTTTTTVTSTSTKTREEEEEEEMERESEERRRLRSSKLREDEEEEDEEDENKRKSRTTRTTTTTTTTTTKTSTSTQQDEEDERLREEQEEQEEQQEQQRKAKRRILVEEEEEQEEVEQQVERSKVKRAKEVTEEVEQQQVEEEEETRSRRKEKLVQMEVDEEEEDEEVSSSSKRRSDQESLQTKRKTSVQSKRRGELEEEEEEEEEILREKSRSLKPKVKSAPKRVLAGLGSSPELEVEVETTIVEETTTTTTVRWLKDNQPISSRLLRDSHVELLERPGDQPNTKKHILRINSLRSSDAGKYKLVAENQHGQVETDEIELEVDRTMRPGQRPSITPADVRPQQAPKVMSVPEEIVAGVGSSPQVEALVEGNPEPKLSWFKDGQPVEELPEFRSGHLEVVDLPSGEEPVKRQALKINQLKPQDVAAYHVKAENPLGEDESEPTNLRIDRSMGPRDEPRVSKQEPVVPMDVDGEELVPRKPQQAGKLPRLPIEERVLEAPEGAQATIQIPVLGQFDKAEWLKDGRPLPSKSSLKPEETPDGVQKLTFKDLKPDDAGAYTVRATNPFGQAESAPIKVNVLRDEPLSKGEKRAPEIVGAPKEVAAGPGSKPELEVLVKANPEPEVEWLKDGKPLTQRQLSDGHLEQQVEHPNPNEPDLSKHTLKVDKLRGTDEADYQLVAKNPLGTAETQPIALKIDRTMGPREEPLVTPAELSTKDEEAPKVISAPEEVVAGPGSKPELAVEIKGEPTPEVQWLKDGEPLPARLLRDGHLEPTSEPTDVPGVTKQVLKINDLKPTDAGEYTLKAENPLGSEESEPIKLKVDRTMSPREEPRVVEAPKPAKGDQQAPQVVKMPEEIVAGAGSSPALEAEIMANPKADVKWFKDGQPIEDRLVRSGHLELVEEPTNVPGVTKHALKINDLRPTDVAAYHLKAENPLGEVESEPINLRIDRSMGPRDEPQVTQAQLDDAEEGKPEIVSAPKEVKAGPGSSPELAVEVKGKPTPEVEWLKDGEPLPARLLRDGHLEPTIEPTDSPDITKQVLKINDLKPADAGDYTLKAKNPQGEEETEPIKVTVDKSMRPQEEPVIIPAGMSASEPAAPKVVSAPKEVVAGLGSKPQIVAEVEGNPEPKMDWFKDGQPIPERDLRNGHVEIVDLPSDKPNVKKQALQINDLKPADAAAYHVKAENPLGEVETEPTNVRIDRSMGPRDEPQVTSTKPEETDEVAPKIISAPEEVVAGPGSKPELAFEIKGEPTPEVQWLKDGEPLPARLLRDGHLEPTSEPTDVPGVTKQVLKINDLKPTDAGEYTLKAENPLGTEESEPIKLKVDRSMGPREEPKVKKPDDVAQLADEMAPKILEAAKELVAGPGSSPVIVADVEASPDAQVQWLKDGEPLPARSLRDGHLEPQVEDLPGDDDDKPTKRHSLKVNDLRPSDAGDYTLRAENPLGEQESAPIKLKVDRSMGPREEPVIIPAEGTTSEPCAPKIMSAPKEVVAGLGSKPQIVAEVEGNPEPKMDWFKDGQPIPERDLRNGHVEIVDLPSDKPNVKKQALQINDLKPADAAAYHVKAKNPLGEAESEPTNLKIDRSMGPKEEPQVTLAKTPTGDEQKPEIKSAPKEVVAGPGSSPELVVEVKGEPVPEVQWLKDGEPLPARLLRDGHLEPTSEPTDVPGVTKQVLKINELKPTDAGEYTLKAENPLGTEESEPIKLKVDRTMSPREEPVVTPAELSTKDEEAPKIISAPEEVVAGPGSKPELAVEIKGEPTPEVQWLKDGEPLPARLLRDGHLEPTSEPTDVPGVTKQVLKINDLKPTDAGEYTLKAENPLGSEESEPIKLKVDRTMSPREEPRVVEAPKPAKGDQQAPQVVKMPEEIVAGAGSSPVLEAEIMANPKADVKWFKDGQPIEDRLVRSGHLELVEEPTNVPGITKHALKINDLRPTDVAAYHLKAENPLGEVESEPINLRIDRSMGPRDEPQVTQAQLDDAGEGKPEIVSAPKEVKAGPGSSPELAVEVKGKPTPEVEWLKDGEPLPTRLLRDGHLEPKSEPTDVPGVTKQVLKINDLKPSDAGDYSLKAENTLGAEELEPIKLTVDRTMGPREEPITSDDTVVPMETDGSSVGLLRPKIVSAPKEVAAAVGSSPALEVEVKGEPTPEVQWLKDGEPLPARLLRDGHLKPTSEPTDVPGVTKQVLKVNDLKPSDVGEYTVKAANPSGSDESQPIKLKVDRSMSKSDEPRVVGETKVKPEDAVAPSIVSMPEEVVAGLDSKPQIIAEASGIPEPEITWFKDGQPLAAGEMGPGKHLEVVNLASDKPDTVKQALQINHLKPQDVAAYHVKAENPVGEAESEPTNLRIDRRMSASDKPQVTKEDMDDETEVEKPKISQVARSIKSPLGSSPVLSVEVSGSQPTKVEWLKDGQVVKESPDMHLELEQLPDGTQRLQINNLKPQDAGIYKLRASNPAGSAESGPITLQVDTMAASEGPRPEFKPEIVNMTELVTSGPGGQPELWVEVKANPEAAVSWFKDGRPLPGERRSSIAHVAQQSEPVGADTVRHLLRVDKMRPSDEATYHLVATNQLGIAESAPIQLKLDKLLDSDEAPLVKLQKDVASSDEFAPQIVSNTDEVVAGLGSSPQLETVIKASPRPQTQWFKDGQPIDTANEHVTVARVPVEVDTIKETLTIHGLKPQDVAAYHLRAENPLGEVESEPTNVRFDRTMMPEDKPLATKTETPFSPDEAERSRGPKRAPTIRRMPRKVVCALGSSPVIELEVDGNPKPEVVWFKDGKQVSEMRGHLTLVELPDGTHKLCLANVKAVDQGDYTVRASNEMGECQSAPISLVIDASMSPRDEPQVIDSTASMDEANKEETSLPSGSFAPKIVRCTERVSGQMGDDALIEVEVRALPAASVQWFHDGEPIPARAVELGHVQLSEEHLKDDNVRYVLRMAELKPSDAGSYHLVADNPLGQAKSPSVPVVVTADDDGDNQNKRKLRAPVIKRIPRQVVAAVGSSPVLEVEISGEPVPEVVWFRNGKRLERSDAHFSWEESPAEGVYRLKVNEVTSNDEATYTVQATNELGTAESGPIQLKVERRPSTAKAGKAPEIVEFPSEVAASLGLPLKLELVVKSAPLPAEITWFVNGKPIKLTKRSEEKVEVIQIDNETTRYVLTLAKVTDEATYHVRAENPLGVAQSETCKVKLEQDDKKKRKMRAPVIRRLPRRIVAGVGSSPVIEIEVTGEPKPEVVWFKNGRRVHEVKGHIEIQEVDGNIYRLCFTDLKVTDQAEYHVTATNEMGSVESSPITLVVDRTMMSSTEPVVQTNQEVPQGDENGPITAPVILGLDKDQEAQVGQTVKLEAEVLGNPKPQIKWLKDGDEVELNILNEVPDSNLHSLTLKNVNDLYDGVYSLEASNPAGVARKDAKVRVVEKLSDTSTAPETTSATLKPSQEPQQPKRKEPEELQEKPFIKRGLKFSQVNQGRSIKFEVQIDGKYDELIWMKDGEQINLPFKEEQEEESIEETMETMTTAVDGYESDVTLQGDDTFGSGKPKRKFPPRIVRRPRNIVAGPGSRVALEVRCEGEPKPTIIWYKNGQVVKTSTSDGKINIEELDDGQLLIIENLEETDVAEYHVVVENPYGSERTEPVRVELDNEMVASDDLANTSCSSFEPNLKRGRAPRILIKPRSVHAPKGSQIAFECQVHGEPNPVVNWFRDGRLISQTSDGHVRIEEYSDGFCRLIISDITDADVGQYHVVAENKLGSERTIPVTLTIDETSSKKTVVEDFNETKHTLETRSKFGRPPRILLRPKNVQAKPGDEIRLEVNVVGHSKPELIWYKDSKRISSSSDGRVTIEQVSSGYQRLVIRNSTEADSGAYTVAAENDFGLATSLPVEVSVSETCETTTTTKTTTTTTSTFYDQFVTQDELDDSPDDQKRKPRFLVRPKNKRAPLKSKVDFECIVKGEPKPEVIWFKNGRRVHESSDGRVRVEEFSDGGCGSRLVLEDLEEADDAVYQAEARNEWGHTRSDEVRLRVVERREVSERIEKVPTKTGGRITTRTKRTRSHYTFSEERHGYVTMTLNDAQLEHDGDYKLVVRNRWGEASTQAPLVVIPKVEPRGLSRASQRAPSADSARTDSAEPRARRTPLDQLEDYGHELDKQVGVFGSESRYQSGEDTYLLQLRDTEFPLRLRKYLRFGARQSPSLRSSLMDAHWGAGARVTVRERRKFREVMDEEIEDERRGLDARPTPMRLQKEVGTCGYAAAQLEHLRVEAAERVARRSASVEPTAGTIHDDCDMMPPFFREKLKDCVVEESPSSLGQVAVFACLAAGSPAPEYSWFRNDIIITGTEQRMELVERPDGGSELHIRDPRLHDSGCFKCVARNVHGNVTCRARLRVAARPSRPEPPEFVSVTARQLFLEWRPPRDYDVNAAEVLGYRLEMSQSELGQQDQWRVLAADIGHEYYVVDDLTPATSYSFRVSARNKFGWSDSSYSTYVTTCREPADAAETPRLQVPHGFRQRQFVADIVDLHLLRHCEEDKQPKLNYRLEQSPIQLEKHRRWQEDWQLQSEIARGRFSLISKCQGVANQEQAALKAVLLSQQAAAQTKSEFDILRSLQHEKVAALKAAYRVEDELFVFVLERLSGIDVLTYLSSFTSYNEDQVSRIITQVMDAIEYLHFRGMCLLELLPDNVVMADGRSTAIKLVDFSSARFVPRSGARVPINSSQSLEYCPPEVMANHEVSTASDVWCIGVLTYVLLSGFSPFKGETEEETKENVRLGRFTYDHIYPNCTPEVTRFLINVFKKHSSSRPTIEQLYENKWLLPNEFMIRKRQHAVFNTDKIVAFAEQFHRLKMEDPETCAQKVADLLQSS